MPNFRSFFIFSITVLGVGLSVPAGATTVTIGATAPAGYSATTFSAGNSASGPGSWTFGGTSITANMSVGTPTTCLDPLSSTGTTAYFACATAGSTITANFAGGITGFDLVWGSPDGYNTLTFFTGPNGTGSSESFVPGVSPLTVAVAPLAAPVLFVANAGVVWDSVTFTSSFNSFEFATVETLAAASSTTPEPSSVALLSAGLLAVFVGVLRRRKSA